MDPMAISFHPLLEQQIQVIPIFVIEENVLPAVSAQHYMIASTGYVKSWFSSHDRDFRPTYKLMQIHRLDPTPLNRSPCDVRF